MVLGSTISGRFEVTERVGTGGMATVYRAYDHQEDRSVAVKIMRATTATALRRFAREAEVLAALRHPAIVRYMAHGETEDGSSFIAMEWVDGETLAQRLEQRGISPSEAFAMATGLAEALGEAHRHGVVHRDLKPSNILFPSAAPLRPKLIDFGVARVGETLRGLTKTGGIVGTPAYMSPEQARGDRELDARSDVFSLGAVLYECLAGRAPFGGEHLLAIQAKVIFADPPALRESWPDVPAAVEALMARLLAKDPRARPADGAELEVALREVGPIPDGPPRRARRVDIPTTMVAGTLADQPRGFLVLATIPGKGPVTADERATRLAAVEDVRIPDRSQVTALADGSVAILVRAEPNVDVAVRQAAELARSIRRTLPDAVVALTCALGDRGLATAVDHASQALAAEALSSIFAPTLDTPTLGDAGAICVDETTASLLEADFPISHDGSGRCYLGSKS